MKDYRRKFVNVSQSKEERKTKYDMIRNAGYSWQIAIRLRDWHLERVISFLNSNNKEVIANE